ncbi:TolC family protein [Muribaculaceae bacterium Isolate-002 (NCI)]|nr:TolC family protein [Muribaculaceae bacterium Isolate-002 (NCI)]
MIITVMKRLSIAFTAMLSLLGATAQGQAGGEEVRMLTLDECRELAIKNNAKVNVAASNAEAAEELRKEAFTKYFPTVTASGMAFAANKPVVDLDIFNIATLQMIKRGVSANVTAVQPVFAGGRIVNGNRLAEVGVEAAGLERENAVNEVTMTAEKYYWQLVTLKSKRRTLEDVIALVDTLEFQVGVALKAGVTTRNELLKVQLRKNELRSTMVDLDNGIALSRQLLAQYTGLDGTAIDVAEEETPDEVPPYPSDIYIDPNAALGSTADYRLLQKKVNASELEEKIAVGENLPTVGVGAGYFYDDVISQRHGFGAVFVSVSVPISSWWGGSHAIKRRKLETANARMEMNDLSQMLCIKMINAWDDLTSAHRKMEIAKESIAQSAENLRMNQNFFHAGVSNVTDLLDAQTLYRQSLDQYTEAYGAYRVARVSYLQATGQEE